MRSVSRKGQTIHDVQTWIVRHRNLVQHATERRVVFLVGAAISRQADGSGAWGVQQMLERVGEIHGIRSETDDLGDRYQEVLELLKAQAGPNAIETLVHEAVLAAAKDCELKAKALREPGGAKARQILQEGRNDRPWVNWNIPAGVSALADVIGHIESQLKGNDVARHPVIFTTNFDGLLELALMERGINFQSHVSAADEYPQQLGNSVDIVHVHGYWTKSPTLHTADVLSTPRDKLRSAIERCLDGAIVSVMAYGGWDDLMSETLSGALSAIRTEDLPEVLWAFFDDVKKVSAADRESNSAHVLLLFKDVLARCRVTYYAGFDVHVHLALVVAGHSESQESGASSPPGSAGDRASDLAELVRTLLKSTPPTERTLIKRLTDPPVFDSPCAALGAIVSAAEKCKEGAERDAFTRAAWPIVSRLAGVLLEAPTSFDVRSSKPQPIPRQTALSAEVYMAHAQDRDELRLGPGLYGPVSPDLVSHDEDAKNWVEDGGDSVTRVADFKSSVWKRLKPTEDFDELQLRAQLSAARFKARKPYALVSQEHARASELLARELPEITFLVSGKNADVGPSCDELTLGVLWNDFLTLYKANS